MQPQHLCPHFKSTNWKREKKNNRICDRQKKAHYKFSSLPCLPLPQIVAQFIFTV